MLTLHTLTPHFGAEIIGLNLSHALSARTTDAVSRVLDTHGIVLVQHQQFTAETFLAFSRALGELAVLPQPNVSHPRHAELTLLSNIIENGAPIGLAESGSQWRMDGAHLKTPYRATLHYAVEIPQKAGVPLGDTWLASTAATHDALAPALRQQLQGMRAVHIHGAGRKRRSTPFFPDSGLTQIFRKGIEHPLLRAHPNTGRKCLYVNPVSTSHVCGMNDGDSDALLAELYQHLANPLFHFCHQWQVGDLLIWDNCSIEHRTVSDYAWPLRRLMYRTFIKGAPGR